MLNVDIKNIRKIFPDSCICADAKLMDGRVRPPLPKKKSVENQWNMGDYWTPQLKGCIGNH